MKKTLIIIGIALIVCLIAAGIIIKLKIFQTFTWTGLVVSNTKTEMKVKVLADGYYPKGEIVNIENKGKIAISPVMLTPSKKPSFNTSSLINFNQVGPSSLVIVKSRKIFTIKPVAINVVVPQVFFGDIKQLDLTKNQIIVDKTSQNTTSSASPVYTAIKTSATVTLPENFSKITGKDSASAAKTDLKVGQQVLLSFDTPQPIDKISTPYLITISAEVK